MSNSLTFDLPRDESPIIKVIGVGGGGSNAVNHMFNQGIVGVDFAICNTDAQAMEISPVPTRIQLGPALTEGRGAGSKPNVGKMACEESIEDVRRYLENNCKMLFVTAGMGGGTGTGAAPIIAKAAQEMDILTVGIVTLPFSFEGKRRLHQAMEGLEDMKRNVDTLIVISNDKLRQIYGNLSLSNAFGQADNILTTAAKGIAEIITVTGYVNVDFEDVNTVMRQSGVAIMGTATVEGDDRAKRAVDEALHSPLLEDNDIQGAQHILLNITSGTKEVTMDEIFEITEFVQEEAGHGTDLIWGNCFDEKLGEGLNVTVIATGFEDRGRTARRKEQGPIKVPLDGEQKRTDGKGIISQLGYTGGESDNAHTYEFDDITPNRESRNADMYSDYLTEEELERQEAEKRRRQAHEERRKEHLRNAGKRKLNNPQTINEMENIPAYMRREVNLDDVPDSGEVGLSSWTISEEDEPELREGNSFLHDNVD